MTYLRRRIGEDVQYCGVWEWQERGVLHRHFMVRVDRPITTKRVTAAVRGASRRWEFGRQVDVQSITGDCARQVWYVAKYASKTTDAMHGRPVLDRSTGEFKRCRGFRAWSASRSWGETMKVVRERQQAWVRAGGVLNGAASAVASPGGAAALDPNSGTSTVNPSGVADVPGVAVVPVLL